MKTKILEMLRSASKNFVSGESIAEKLEVSRTAIWKHIQSLRKRGYKISSSERLGYKLDETPDLLLPEIVQYGLQTEIIAAENKVIYKNSVDSTNELAKKLAAEGALDGTIIVAEEQTGGKGRLQRNFFSPKEKGIWFSVILRPQCLPKDAPKFTLMAAVAVAQAMEKFNLRAEIKWPNDILFDGRKLVGILTEMSAEIGHVNYIVVGIGINVRREEFPAAIREIATSLSEMAGENLNRVEFFRALLEEIDKLYIENNFDTVFKLWRKYNITLGKKVTVLSAESGDIFTGLAVDIDAEGALIVDSGGEKKIVYAGDVSIRPAK